LPQHVLELLSEQKPKVKPERFNAKRINKDKENISFIFVLIILNSIL